MNRIIFILMTALMLCTGAEGKNRTVTENDNQGNKKRVIELRDTVVDGKTVTDTLSVMTYLDSSSYEADNEDEPQENEHQGIKINLGNHTSESIVAIIAIVFIFGVPTFIVFIIFYFRHKNRKAKYELAERALAAGQPLPAEFFKELTVKDNRTKGIRNIFTGLGLFIFLWACTESFGLASIGLLVMFTGFGQVVIYYTQQPKDKDKDEQ
ncbi:MAG: DUF6249 domain-containing protein [Bacteroides sp.]|nr:DUF6249 domain-containing protein [Bacteroides sp.]